MLSPPPGLSPQPGPDKPDQTLDPAVAGWQVLTNRKAKKIPTGVLGVPVGNGGSGVAPDREEPGRIPACDDCLASGQGLEPRFPGPKPGVLPVRRPRNGVIAVDLEPAARTRTRNHPSTKRALYQLELRWQRGFVFGYSYPCLYLTVLTVPPRPVSPGYGGLFGQ